MNTPSLAANDLERDGWALLDDVYPPDHLARLRTCSTRLSTLEDHAVRERDGAVYAARNVLELCPELITLWRTEQLVSFVRMVLGPDAGLVRALYFDKPPEQTWALPWHKDLLIAVRDDSQAPGYSRPRLRAGVWHCEPPVEVLERMLTLRIHLDAMTLENGPLQVLTGSQRSGKRLVLHGYAPHTITSPPGAVFAMRPLLAHASGRSDPTCTVHRRVLHLEFNGTPRLPGERIEWNQFFTVGSPGLDPVANPAEPDRHTVSRVDS